MILYPQTVEIWKRVSSFVEVSTFGNKRTYDKIVNFKEGYFGYDGRHVLIAKAFIPNPNHLPVVHHIDGNKLNNSVWNLKWVTYQENIIDPARTIKFLNRRKGVKQPNISKSKMKLIRVWNDKGFDRVFDSLNDAVTQLNVSQSNLSKVANGQRSHTKGYYAEYLEDKK